MFDQLSERFTKIVRQLRGQARLTEDNITDTLREVRMVLLEADVALPVVREFIDSVKERALGRDVAASLNPGQMTLKIVNEELVKLMGLKTVGLNLSTQPPAVIMVAGLQGSGKTTTVAKLARYIKGQLGKKVMVVSCDTYRAAAIEQLKVMAGRLEVEWCPSDPGEHPPDIARAALARARKQFIDVLLVDTAGRLHVDSDMMAEISCLNEQLQPIERLFVVDSMMGQDAVNAAKVFNDTLDLTGVILTKTDGDARGGAALSVRHVIGKPIKYLGTGEKDIDLTSFHPDRIASRILGMGDTLSLIEEIEQKVDRKKADKLAKKLKRGKGFNLSDFREQLRQMRNIGGIEDLLGKLPKMGIIPQQATLQQVDDKQFIKFEAIIDSMTLQERNNSAIINGSRKKRIASGSGTQIQDVNRLIKQFNQMQKMMKKMSKKGGMAKMMRGIGGRFPPGTGF